LRVSDSMNYNKTNEALSKNRTEMSDLQTQAASQKRVNKPSDDPVGTTQIMKSKTESKGIEQYLKNLDFAQSFLNFTDQSLDEVTGALTRAKELTLSQANDPSASDITRKAVATEIRQLYNQTLQVANRKMGNRFVFGGYDTTSTPFKADGTYKGDRGEIMIEINKGSYVPMNLPGDIVFLGRDAKSTGVLSSVPADPGELNQTQMQEIKKRDEHAEPPGSIRAPSSMSNSEAAKDSDLGDMSVFLEGENVFKVLANLETGLVSNDKAAIQDTIEKIDTVMDQIVHARSKVGSRVMNLTNTMDSLQKAGVDEKARQSSIEDVDTYALFSNLSQNESTLKATMATSAKILQPSLLDFIK
jgi:flagellar hook-associated protein 3 FlgL